VTLMEVLVDCQFADGLRLCRESAPEIIIETKGGEFACQGEPYTLIVNDLEVDDWRLA